jgi:hypothetical protein
MILWSLYVLTGVALAFALFAWAAINIEDPYDRVAYYLTFLSADVILSVVAYSLLSWHAFVIVSAVLFGKLAAWSLSNHRNMVHYIHEE